MMESSELENVPVATAASEDKEQKVDEVDNLSTKSYQQMDRENEETEEETRSVASSDGSHHLNAELETGYKILIDLMAESRKAVNWPFMESIEVSAPDLYEDYKKRIEHPMWLKLMKQKFEESHYSTITEFVSDFRLMLENCYRFNGPDHYVSKRGQKLETMLEQKLVLLSRELREKTSIEATSGQKTEDSTSGLGLRRRTKHHLHHDSTVLLNQLREEEQQKVREYRRQMILDRRAEKEALVQEILDWEDNVLFAGKYKQQMKAMWEIPQIGLFLFLCQGPLNIGEVMHFELERAFLIPRESSTMQLVMTSLLSTPFQRLKIDKKNLMPYKIWEEKLSLKLQLWYKVFTDTGGDVEKTCSKLGLDEEFFEIVGKKNPLEKKRFHVLSYYRKVWIVKAVCDYCLQTQDSLRETIELQPFPDQREYMLGVDASGRRYIHFPQFCGADVRIYRQAPIKYPKIEIKPDSFDNKRKFPLVYKPPPAKKIRLKKKRLKKVEKSAAVLSPVRSRPSRLRQTIKSVVPLQIGDSTESGGSSSDDDADTNNDDTNTDAEEAGDRAEDSDNNDLNSVDMDNKSEGKNSSGSDATIPYCDSDSNNSMSSRDCSRESSPYLTPIDLGLRRSARLDKLSDASREASPLIFDSDFGLRRSGRGSKSKLKNTPTYKASRNLTNFLLDENSASNSSAFGEASSGIWKDTLVTNENSSETGEESNGCDIKTLFSNSNKRESVESSSESKDIPKRLENHSVAQSTSSDCSDKGRISSNVESSTECKSGKSNGTDSDCNYDSPQQSISDNTQCSDETRCNNDRRLNSESEKEWSDLPVEQHHGAIVNGEASSSEKASNDLDHGDACSSEMASNDMDHVKSGESDKLTCMECDTNGDNEAEPETSVNSDVSKCENGKSDDDDEEEGERRGNCLEDMESESMGESCIMDSTGISFDVGRDTSLPVSSEDSIYCKSNTDDENVAIVTESNYDCDTKAATESSMIDDASDSGKVDSVSSLVSSSQHAKENCSGVTECQDLKSNDVDNECSHSCNDDEQAKINSVTTMDIDQVAADESSTLTDSVVKKEPVDEQFDKMETEDEQSSVIKTADVRDIKEEEDIACKIKKEAMNTADVKTCKTEDGAAEDTPIEKKPEDIKIEKKEETEEEEEEEEREPDITKFELLADSVEGLRNLTLEFAEPEPIVIRKGKKEQVMRPIPRKKSEVILHDRLQFLLKELEPWESKLQQACRRARIRVRKEVEDYIEPSMDENNAWNSTDEETESGSSADEGDSDSDAISDARPKPAIIKPTKGGNSRCSTPVKLEDFDEIDVSQRGRLRKRRIIPNNAEDQIAPKKAKPILKSEPSVSTTSAAPVVVQAGKSQMVDYTDILRQLRTGGAAVRGVSPILIKTTQGGRTVLTSVLPVGSSGSSGNVVGLQNLQNVRFISPAGSAATPVTDPMKLALQGATKVSQHPTIQNLLSAMPISLAGPAGTTGRKITTPSSSLVQILPQTSNTGSKTAASGMTVLPRLIQPQTSAVKAQVLHLPPNLSQRQTTPQKLLLPANQTTPQKVVLSQTTPQKVVLSQTVTPKKIAPNTSAPSDDKGKVKYYAANASTLPINVVQQLLATRGAKLQTGPNQQSILYIPMESEGQTRNVAVSGVNPPITSPVQTTSPENKPTADVTQSAAAAGSASGVSPQGRSVNVVTPILPKPPNTGLSTSPVFSVGLTAGTPGAPSASPTTQMKTTSGMLPSPTGKIMVAVTNASSGGIRPVAGVQSRVGGLQGNNYGLTVASKPYQFPPTSPPRYPTNETVRTLLDKRKSVDEKSVPAAVKKSVEMYPPATYPCIASQLQALGSKPMNTSVMLKTIPVSHIAQNSKIESIQTVQNQKMIAPQVSVTATKSDTEAVDERKKDLVTAALGVSSVIPAVTSVQQCMITSISPAKLNTLLLQTSAAGAKSIPSMIKLPSKAVLDSAVKAVVTSVSTSLPTVNIKVPSPTSLPSIGPRRNVTKTIQTMKSPIPVAPKVVTQNSGQTSLSVAGTHSPLSSAAVTSLTGSSAPNTATAQQTQVAAIVQNVDGKNVLTRVPTQTFLTSKGLVQMGYLQQPRMIIPKAQQAGSPQLQIGAQSAAAVLNQLGLQTLKHDQAGNQTVQGMQLVQNSAGQLQLVQRTSPVMQMNQKQTLLQPVASSQTLMQPVASNQTLLQPVASNQTLLQPVASSQQQLISNTCSSSQTVSQQSKPPVVALTALGNHVVVTSLPPRLIQPALHTSTSKPIVALTASGSHVIISQAAATAKVSNSQSKVFNPLSCPATILPKCSSMPVNASQPGQPSPIATTMSPLSLNNTTPLKSPTIFGANVDMKSPSLAAVGTSFILPQSLPGVLNPAGQSPVGSPVPPSPLLNMQPGLFLPGGGFQLASPVMNPVGLNLLPQGVALQSPAAIIPAAAATGAQNKNLLPPQFVPSSLQQMMTINPLLLTTSGQQGLQREVTSQVMALNSSAPVMQVTQCSQRQSVPHDSDSPAAGAGINPMPSPVSGRHLDPPSQIGQPLLMTQPPLSIAPVKTETVSTSKIWTPPVEKQLVFHNVNYGAASSEKQLVFHYISPGQIQSAAVSHTPDLTTQSAVKNLNTTFANIDGHIKTEVGVKTEVGSEGHSPMETAPSPTPQNAAMSGSIPQNIVMPGTTPLNVAMPGTTPLNVTMPGTTPQNIAMPGSIPQNIAMPGTTPLNIAMPGTTPQNIAMAGTNAQNIVMPGTTSQNIAMPGSTPQNIAMPGTTPQNIAMPGSTPQNIAMPGTTPQNIAMPGSTPQNIAMPGSNISVMKTAISGVQGSQQAGEASIQSGTLPVGNVKHPELSSLKLPGAQQKLLLFSIGGQLVTGQGVPVTLSQGVLKLMPQGKVQIANQTLTPEQIQQTLAKISHSTVQTGTLNIPNSSTAKSMPGQTAAVVNQQGDPAKLQIKVENVDKEITNSSGQQNSVADHSYQNKHRAMKISIPPSSSSSVIDSSSAIPPPSSSSVLVDSSSDLKTVVEQASPDIHQPVSQVIDKNVDVAVVSSVQTSEAVTGPLVYVTPRATRTQYVMKPMVYSSGYIVCPVTTSSEKSTSSIPVVTDLDSLYETKQSLNKARMKSDSEGYTVKAPVKLGANVAGATGYVLKAPIKGEVNVNGQDTNDVSTDSEDTDTDEENDKGHLVIDDSIVEKEAALNLLTLANQAIAGQEGVDEKGDAH